MATYNTYAKLYVINCIRTAAKNTSRIFTVISIWLAVFDLRFSIDNVFILLNVIIQTSFIYLLMPGHILIM